MTVAEFVRLLSCMLIASTIVFVIVMPIIELISMESERRWNKLNKDIDKMLEDLRKEREFIKEKINESKTVD